ncbi:hypothetical protein OPV22_028128 [Ensete ventricosum]|uniref:Uncharacterized protein n=1 Tax=Ensete ventricosum TaxID=4639 RepID=A0AAV8Q7N3_ENSVE|nr:hypothetical protein OPV22_028128 [Ensete ventricosum]
MTVDVPGCSWVHGTGAMEEEPWMAAPATQGITVDVPGYSWVHGTGAMEEESWMTTPASQGAMVHGTGAMEEEPWMTNLQPRVRWLMSLCVLVYLTREPLEKSHLARISPQC